MGLILAWKHTYVQLILCMLVPLQLQKMALLITLVEKFANNWECNISNPGLTSAQASPHREPVGGRDASWALA